MMDFRIRKSYQAKTFYLFNSLTFSVQEMKYSFFGGCISSQTIATGEKTELIQLLRLVGKFVDIFEEGKPIWWGFINSVSVQIGKTILEVSLKDLYNAVKVVYTDGFSRKDTDWFSDDESIETFGRKEILQSENDITEAEANTIAVRFLNLHKQPNVSIQLSNLSSQKPIAILDCLGLLSLFDWRYYKNEKGKEGYTETGSGGREIGEDERPKAGMTFKIASEEGWMAKKIRLRPWKYPESNPPSDDLIVKICADNSGQPGTVLAQAIYTASEIDFISDWKEKELGNAVFLQPNTMYWITIERSGGVDKTKYFMVDTNRDNGYERGNFYLFYTSDNTWRLKDDKGHLNFEILGDVSIQEQITEMVEDYFPFIKSVLFDEPITNETNPYRNGDIKCLEELRKFLRLAAGQGIRWTCTIDENYRLIVEKEKSKDAYEYYLDSRGRIFDRRGNETERIKVGNWYRLKDLETTNIGARKILDIGSFFIEEITWRNGKWSISRTRDEMNDYDFKGIRI